jgi:hypothetical protein
MYGFGITARNVNEALPLGLNLIKTHGRPITVRGLETLEVPGPVCTVYRCPDERVLFDAERDANPFFHFFECLWILAGARTVQLPRFFLQRITDYSDDSTEFHGAYGHRLRYAYEFDQIERAVELLREKPDTRQCVLSIWHPGLDLGVNSKDIPCNDTIAFKIRDGKLNMTVFNRSNDVIWGAYGANAVQFSFLQEYIASRVGVQMGYYTQVSDSYHVYVDNPYWKKYVSGLHAPHGHVANPYDDYLSDDMGVKSEPLFLDTRDASDAHADAVLFNYLAEAGSLPAALTGPTRMAFHSHLFKTVALPMLESYVNYKAGDFTGALSAASDIKAKDWSAACSAWVRRREQRRASL